MCSKGPGKYAQTKPLNNSTVRGEESPIKDPKGKERVSLCILDRVCFTLHDAHSFLSFQPRRFSIFDVKRRKKFARKAIVQFGSVVFLNIRVAKTLKQSKDARHEETCAHIHTHHTHTHTHTHTHKRARTHAHTRIQCARSHTHTRVFLLFPLGIFQACLAPENNKFKESDAFSRHQKLMSQPFERWFVLLSLQAQQPATALHSVSLSSTSVREAASVQVWGFSITRPAVWGLPAFCARSLGVCLDSDQNHTATISWNFSVPDLICFAVAGTNEVHGRQSQRPNLSCCSDSNAESFHVTLQSRHLQPLWTRIREGTFIREI